MVTKMRRSIFLRFLVLVLSCVVAAVIVSSLILIVFSYAQFNTTIRNNYRGILKSSANEIRFFVLESRNSLESFARVLTHVLGGEDEARTDIILAAFGFKNSKFSHLALLRTDGTRRLPQYPPDQDLDYPSTATFLQALEGKSAISEVMYTEDRLPFIRMAIPITRLGKTEEILWAELNLKAVWNVLEGIRIGKKGYVSVLNSAGQYVSHLEIQPVLKRIPTEHIGVLEKIRFTDNVIDWRETLDGNFGMVTHIADLDWYVILNQPISEIYGHIYRGLFWVTGLTLILCLLVSLVCWRWVEKLLKPLKLLHHQVRVIGAGVLDQPVVANTEDEIGDLAREFNTMSDSLKQVIEDKLRMERDLIHAKHLAVLGEASGKMTHEVGNLVNNTSLFLNMLKKKLLDTQSQKLISLLQEDMARAMAFAKDWLLFARKPQFDTVGVPIGPLIEEALEVHREAALQQGVTLTTHWADALVSVPVNRNQIHQVINNLVKNSLDALKEAGGKGQITVTGYSSNGRFCLSVADSGTGISPETQPYIFEPFFTTKGRTGTGLGLAIIQDIIKTHGGQIELVSTPGGGAEFRLYFPIETGGPQPA